MTAAGAPASQLDHGSSARTEGVRVSVRPRFIDEHSDHGSGQYLFAYRVEIRNESAEPARLVRRRWVIIDADGVEQVVAGEGVLGVQPYLPPGAAHEYESFCPLETAWGTMEGSYTMRRDDGREFEARVARFYLVAHTRRA